MKLKISGGCATDIGTARKENQDAVFFRQIEQSGRSFALGAVCDGIGGLQAGKEASALVIDGIEQWFCGICSWIDIKKAEYDVLFSHVKDAAEQWNQSVIDFNQENQLRSGTTMSVALIIRDRYYILHVGDSRVYCCSGGELQQMTMDDTLIKNVNGRERGYLTNYMGKSDQLQFASISGKLGRGDLLIYGSDGFYHNFVKKDAVQYLDDHYRKNIPLDEICTQAVQTMEERGETDNVSVGMIAVHRGSGSRLFNSATGWLGGRRETRVKEIPPDSAAWK